MTIVIRIACALVLLMMLGAITNTPSAAAQTETTYRPFKEMWAAKRANVRAGPSTGHEKLDLLEVGKPVYVVGKIDNWFQIRTLKGQPKRYVYAPLMVDYNPTKTTAFTYNNGDIYRGTLRDGVQHGRGVYTWASGGSYDGEWYNGNFHGHGVRIYASGNRYEGDFVKDKRTGRGIFTWANGNRYEGNFVESKRTGRGIFTWANGNRYEGDFVEGKRTGRGVFTWASGSRYEGDFVDNKRTGQALYTWGTDGRYVGGFVDGVYHGRGSLTWDGGDMHYEGNFRDGKMHGKGVLTYAYGGSRNGQWRNGKIHGRSTWSWGDGDVHQDEWKDGKKLRHTHKPESTCLSLERGNEPFAYWINRCSVGIDVTWASEGVCQSRLGKNFTCSWFVPANDRVTTLAKGRVWYRECKSPGGLGDVVAIEKSAGRVYCMDTLGSRSLKRTKEQRSMTRQLVQRAEERAASEWDRQETEWDRQEAERKRKIPIIYDDCRYSEYTCGVN